MELMSKTFLTYREKHKISFEISWDFFVRQFGSTGVISVRYQLPCYIVFVFRGNKAPGHDTFSRLSSLFSWSFFCKRGWICSHSIRMYYVMCSVTILAHALKSVTVVAARSVAVALCICLFSRRYMSGGKKLRLIIGSN